MLNIQTGASYTIGYLSGSFKNYKLSQAVVAHALNSSFWEAEEANLEFKANLAYNRVS